MVKFNMTPQEEALLQYRDGYIDKLEALNTDTEYTLEKVLDRVEEDLLYLVKVKDSEEEILRNAPVYIAIVQELRSVYSAKLTHYDNLGKYGAYLPPVTPEKKEEAAGNG